MGPDIEFIGRGVDESVTVEDENIEEEWTPSDVQSVTAERFPLRMFSQGQIAELAGENQSDLMRVIDEVAGTSELQTEFEARCNSFYSIRSRIRELTSILNARLDPLKIELQDVERKLSQFESSENKAILTEFRRSGLQSDEVQRQFETADENATKIELAADSLVMESVAGDLFDVGVDNERQLIEVLNETKAAVDAAAKEVREVSKRLRDGIGERRVIVEDSDWRENARRAISEYDSLVEKFQKLGIDDPTEYAELVKQRNRLSGETDALTATEDECEELTAQAKNGLNDVLIARRNISAKRNQYLQSIIQANNYVHIEVVAYGLLERVIEGSIRERLSLVDERFQNQILTNNRSGGLIGIVGELVEELPIDADERATEMENRLLNLKQILHAACVGKGNLDGRFTNYLSTQYTSTPSFLDGIWTWFPEDGLKISYSRSGDGTEFQPIAQASAGQRGAAMLAFLLAQGSEPLVLDQPEDDLDNQLIYDLVVRQIKENKLRRQLIVITHNPNIVVNGDAEMLHALEFEDGQCVVKTSGSLQDRVMRERGMSSNGGW